MTSLPTAGLSNAVELYAKKILSASVDGAGNYVRPSGEHLMFADAELATREAKACGSAAAPGGTSLTEIRALWHEVQSHDGSGDSAWLNPVKVNGEPSIGDLKKLMSVRYSAAFNEWGMRPSSSSVSTRRTKPPSSSRSRRS